EGGAVPAPAPSGCPRAQRLSRGRGATPLLPLPGPRRPQPLPRGRLSGRPVGRPRARASACRPKPPAERFSPQPPPSLRKSLSAVLRPHLLVPENSRGP
ncbi:hypothetical protein LEMLEM_LOCUS6176, partial [Lemmus lemmus]